MKNKTPFGTFAEGGYYAIDSIRNDQIPISSFAASRASCALLKYSSAF